MIINPDVNSVLPVRMDVLLRASNLIKDQTVFTYFIYEEAIQANNFRVTQLHANKEYQKAGILAHRTITELIELLSFTCPPYIGADITQMATNTASHIMTAGVTLSFHFFFRASLEHHKYYRQDYPIAGISDSTYATQVSPTPTVSSFNQRIINPWDVTLQRFFNASGQTMDSMGFCIFLYEEGCQVISKLIHRHISDGNTDAAAALAAKYLPELVMLVEWTTASPLNYPSILYSRGMTLFYANFYKATLLLFLYARSLSSATSTYNGVPLTDMQYIDSSGNLVTMSDACKMEGSIFEDPAPIVAAARAAGLGR